MHFANHEQIHLGESLQNQSSKSQGKTHREHQNPELLKYIINYVQFSTTKNYETYNQIGKCDTYLGEVTS